MAPIHYPNGNDATLRVGKLAGPRSRGVMRAAGGGVALPDFTTALFAFANWGLTPDWREGDSGERLYVMAGGSSPDESIYGEPTDPWRCDLPSIVPVGANPTVVQWEDQSGNNEDMLDGYAPPAYISIYEIIVTNAGTAAVNGTYLLWQIHNGRPSYYHSGFAPGDGPYIRWEGYWLIRAGAEQYNSTDDVITPDLVTTWNYSFGDAPLPDVEAGDPLTGWTQFDTDISSNLETRNLVDLSSTSQVTVHWFGAFLDELSDVPFLSFGVPRFDPGTFHIEQVGTTVKITINSLGNNKTEFLSYGFDTFWKLISVVFDTEATGSNAIVPYVNGQPLNGEYGEAVYDGLGLDEFLFALGGFGDGGFTNTACHFAAMWPVAQTQEEIAALSDYVFAASGVNA